MNATIKRFGHPATLIREYDHWVVLLRPDQPTLGSLVLAAKSDETAFGSLPAAAFAELAMVIAAIEQSLEGAVQPRRINYLMLMMVDPHVHFHVIPRHDGTRTACGLEKADAGWPKAPDLSAAIMLDAQQIAVMTDWLRASWR